MTTGPPNVVEHGGPDLAELRRLGVDPVTLLDFSVCTNPFGPSPTVRRALAEANIEPYPDPEAHAFRSGVATKFGIAPGCILAGNGVSELIWLAALAFIRPNDRVLVIGPTYGEYARSARLCGAKLHVFNGFAVDLERRPPHPQPLPPGGASGELDRIAAEVKRHNPHLVFICNPNNPTGEVIDPHAILCLARDHAHTLFVVDEAYQAFVPGLPSLVPIDQDNLLVLRSLTKDYALAGLRIGYAAGPTALIDALARVRPPWSVNSLAQAAAIAALRDDTHLAWSLEQLHGATAELVAGLTRLGFDVRPSRTHYFLVRVQAAAEFRHKLLQRGILVRDAASFGLPGFVRIATRRPEHNARLLAILKEGL